MSAKEKAVVIGAGMGGLAAAIRLSALGLSVTVVDMADAPGGKARNRNKPGLTILVAIGDLISGHRHFRRVLKKTIAPQSHPTQAKKWQFCGVIHKPLVAC